MRPVVNVVCVSAAAEFPRLVPGGTEAGSGVGALEAVGQPAEQKRGFEGKGRGLFSKGPVVPSPNPITGPDLESLGYKLKFVGF